MKRIIFIRHAKTEQGEDDFNRELTKKGKATALMMAKRLKNRAICIDKIFTSSAKRALKTAQIFAKELEIKNLKRSKKLYEANLENMVDFISKIDNNLETIMVVGHNPTLARICEFLSDSYIQKLPTSAIFAIEFDIDNFNQISNQHGNVVFFDYPKKSE